MDNLAEPPIVNVPTNELDHAPVLHTSGVLPAPQGSVPTALHAIPLVDQRQSALDFYNFLTSPNPQLLQLNEDSSPFVALVNIPRTCDVKVVFCAGMGSTPIGTTPSPIAQKLLFLHGDGNEELGPPHPLAFPSSMVTREEVAVMSEDQLLQALATKGDTFCYPLVPNTRIDESATLMKMAPIPPYFVYDGFDANLNAALVYERLLCHSEGDNVMFDALKQFLRACLSGQPARGQRIYLTSGIFSAPASSAARRWAKAKFHTCFPSLHPIKIAEPPQSHPNIPSTNELSTVLAALLPKITPDQTPTTSPTKADEQKATMSEGELRSTLVMCGESSTGDATMLPQWFQECAAKGTSEQFQMTIIRKWLMAAAFYDDADIPITAPLLKMIWKRAWAGKDGNISRPSLINAMEGLSPFAMLDMDEDAVAQINDEDALLDAASLISVADLRALRQRMKISIPEEAEEFMLILKRFGNLLFALFSEKCPLFRAVNEVVKALKAYSREARKNMPTNTKGSILWIILLQARQFSLGEVHPLFEFTRKHEDLRAKKASILHSEVPLELLISSPAKRALDPDKDATKSDKRQRADENPNVWHQKIRAALEVPLRLAGNPSLSTVMKFCKTDAYSIFPKGSNICVPNAFFGSCHFGPKCKRVHKLPTDEQAKKMLDLVQPFISDPMKCKTGQ